MHMLKKNFLTVLCFVLFLGSHAQEDENVTNAFQGTRLINAHSANLAEKGELLLQVQHRFGDISDGLSEFFGLDFATMRLGFEYGFGNNFNLGVGRSAYMKTYDGFAKYRLARQTNEFPVTLVVTATGSIPTIQNVIPENYDEFTDKLSGHVQLHVAKTVKSFSVQVSPGFMYTGYLPFENEKLSFFTLGLGGSVKVSDKVSINAEFLPRFDEDKLNNQIPLSAGVDIDTGGHLFQLMISNGQQMFDQAVFSTTTGDWKNGNLFFGFNLIREFKLKYY